MTKYHSGANVKNSTKCRVTDLARDLEALKPEAISLMVRAVKADKLLSPSVIRWLRELDTVSIQANVLSAQIGISKKRRANRPPVKFLSLRVLGTAGAIYLFAAAVTYALSIFVQTF